MTTLGLDTWICNTVLLLNIFILKIRVAVTGGGAASYPNVFSSTSRMSFPDIKSTKIKFRYFTYEQSRGKADLTELNEVLAFDENSIRDHWLDSLVVMPEKFRIAT
jgi:hypothetical protein